MKQKTDNTNTLYVIANYLNSQRKRNPYGDLTFGDIAPEQFPVRDQAIETILNLIDYSNNPILGADCRSFEFAQPPGALQRGCAVKNFNHTFYTAGFRPNGAPYYGEIDSIIPIAYFTMPTGITNGRAANFTAIAVTLAIKLTDIYFAENPDITSEDLGRYFEQQLKLALRSSGGSINTNTPPFPIRNPAPYITSILGLSNPYNCE